MRERGEHGKGASAAGGADPGRISTLSIRAARVEDVPAICALWNAAIRDTDITFNAVEKSHDDVRALLQEKAEAGHGFFVADLNGRIEGFAGYGQFRANMGYRRTMEHTIYLTGQVQGRGIGKALMNAVEDHARLAGAHSMWGGITATNAASIAFHEAVGYEHIAFLPEVGFKFGRLRDLVLMRKVL